MGAHGTLCAQGAHGPMGPKRAGGGRKTCPTSEHDLRLSVLPHSLFLHLMLSGHHTFKVNPKEIPNLLLSSTYFKAGPTLIEWPVYVESRCSLGNGSMDVDLI